MSLKSALLFVLSVPWTVAQEQITWGSIVFAYHGEKSPFLQTSNPRITPFGANQAYDAGSTIRARYLKPPENGTSLTDFHPILGISTSAIVNSQLDIMTTDETYLAGSATAFMQGLYPPRGGPVPTSEEYMDAPDSVLLQFPLDGYQYPRIRTVDPSYEPRAMFVGGHLACDNYSTSLFRTITSPAFQARINETQNFYDRLRSTVFSALPEDTPVNFRSASILYEYALYEFNHNSTIYQTKFSNFTRQDLGTLQDLASEQQLWLNTPNANGAISSIAGRTLAGKVYQQFDNLIDNGALSRKLNVIFTSHEPLISFFQLSGLSSQASPSDSRFQNLPAHGSVMVFEMFSYSNANESSDTFREFPPENDLFVRFLFRNGTEETEGLQSYSLFGHGPSVTEVPWLDFREELGEFALYRTETYCRACGTQGPICDPYDNTPSNFGSPSTSGGQNKGGKAALSPAAYGAIGAVVTIAVIAAAFIFLTVFGFRLKRKEKNANRNSDLGQLRISSGTGGFKGAEKLASDTDLRLKGGAGASVIRHERVGSWELNDGPKSPTSLDKDIESGRVRSMADYGRKSDEFDGLERVNPFGDPVKPIDQV